jgi:hypothetical protein
LPQASDAPASESAAVPDLTAGSGPSLLPWILAAIAAIAGAGYLFYRRSALAAADGPDLHAFVPTTPPARSPDVARAPAQAPAPEVAPPPPPVPETPAPTTELPPPNPFGGLISTRMRPWMEIEFNPIGCAVDDDKVVIDFEIVAVNNGNAPARDVLIEARMVNAGADQDQEIGAFFANPVGQGDRVPVIDPTRQLQLRSQIVATRDQVQVYTVNGRQVFVPLVAFNLLYEWSRGQGQTSVGYLVGRETNGDKLAPFNLDLGPRIFRTLDKRQLPQEVRQ